MLSSGDALPNTRMQPSGLAALASGRCGTLRGHATRTAASRLPVERAIAGDHDDNRRRSWRGASRALAVAALKRVLR